MHKRQYITVNLPHLQPSITLPEYLATPLELVINAGTEGINTIELQAAGCIASSSMISRLRARGALISSNRKDAVDTNNRLRKGIAHYTYDGWCNQEQEHDISTDYEKVQK